MQRKKLKKAKKINVLPSCTGATRDPYKCGSRVARVQLGRNTGSRVARVQLGTHTNAGPELHGCNSGEHGFLEVFVCMVVWLSVCRYGCLPDCMSVCLSGVMSTCLPGCMPVWLSVCMSIYMSACTYVCLADCMSACNFDPATLHMHHMQGS